MAAPAVTPAQGLPPPNPITAPDPTVDRTTLLRHNVTTLLHVFTDFVANAQPILCALTDANKADSIQKLAKEISNDPVTKELSNMLNNATTQRVADLLTALSSNNNSVARNDDHRQLPPYLAAAKRAAPDAIVRSLPKLIHGLQNAPLPPTDRIDPKLQAKMPRSINGVFGHERKTFLRVSTEKGDSLARPNDLRFALRQGGLPTPVAIVKTADPRVAYALAPESGAKVMSEAVGHTRKIAASFGRDIPTLQFNIKQDLVSDCSTPDVIRSVLPHLKEEAERLESDECYWTPRFYYASDMRDAHAKLLHKLRTLDASAQEEPIPPRPPRPNPTPRTPRNKRRHDSASTGESPDTARLRLENTPQQVPSASGAQLQAGATHMDLDHNSAQPLIQHTTNQPTAAPITHGSQ